MKFEKVTYQQSYPHPIHGTYLPTKLGAEILLNEGDSLHEALDAAETSLREWISKRHPELISNEQQPITEIKVEEVARPIGLTADDINSCSDLSVLTSYRFVIKKFPDLQALYDQKMKELS